MTTVQTIGGEQVASPLEDNRALLAEAEQQGAHFNLEQWLSYLGKINPQHMALGLERVAEVARRMHLYSDLDYTDTFIVTVAGTNGKGSTSALIADACRRLGCKVGLFTSPHLQRFTERIQIDGQEISEDLLCSCLYEVICAQQPDANITPVYSPAEREKIAAQELDASVAEALSSVQAAGGEATSLEQEQIKEVLAHAQSMGEDEESPHFDPELVSQVIDLTYFEITCLAAIRAMLRAHCQLWVLEVGLGGRLDAVNAFPNDLAIITSIGLDHMKILGDTTTKIAAEKAGIINELGTVILGANIDDAARKEILQIVKRVGANVFIEDQHFRVEVVPAGQSADESTANNGAASAANTATSASTANTASTASAAVSSGTASAASSADHAASHATDLAAAYELCYHDQDLRYALYLPYPRVPVSCAGIALNAIFFIVHCYLQHHSGLHEDLSQIAAALQETALPGRMQKVTGLNEPTEIYLDVAHNVPAAQHLCRCLAEQDQRAAQAQQKPRHRRAVVGMLKDKDIEGVLQVLGKSFTSFYVASLTGERGSEVSRLVQALEQLPEPVAIHAFTTVAEALDAARADALQEQSADKIEQIVVLGSFVTVSEAQRALNVAN